MCNSKLEGGQRCSDRSHTARSATKLNNASRYQERIGNHEEAEELRVRVQKLKNAEQEHGDVVIPHKLPVTEATTKVLRALKDKGLSGFVVGGSVRDSILGLPSKDMDIEVYGGSTEEVAAALKSLGQVDLVGKSFGVLKINIDNEDFDISLPRTDSKVGEGHKGFEVTVDPNLSLADASARRDFTINSMMYDTENEVIIDPHGGYADIQAGKLRHVSDAFDEDPLRVLRGVQMSARFNMDLHPDTVAKAHTLFKESGTIARERVAGEMEKLYMKSKGNPRRGFETLKETGWDAALPGLKEINNESLWSKLDASQPTAKRLQGNDRVAFLSAVVGTQVNPKQREEWMKYTTIGDDIKKRIRKLNQSAPTSYDSYTMRDWADKNLDNVTVKEWSEVNKAVGFDDTKVVAAAKKLGIYNKAERGYVMGRHLLEMYPDRKPGVWMGKMLKDARKAQYSGEFRSEKAGLAWAKKNIDNYPA